MDTLRLDGSNGTLTLHTGVEGRAAKMGHRLEIAVRDWQASADFADGRPSSARLRAELSSLEVVSGEGGVKPLSDRDRASIRDNAMETLQAAQHPQVTFESDRIEPTPGGSGYAVTGRLQVAGVTRPATVEVAVEDAGASWRLHAETAVVQSEHGVKPYSAMMGGLKVSDRVGVRLTATAPRD